MYLHHQRLNLVSIAARDLLTVVFNELVATQEDHLALGKKFQALTIESMNEGGPMCRIWLVMAMFTFRRSVEPYL